ncbi:hypothetical protein [Bradyrhizobium sp. USDA 336]|uniref:hypothetical protein n=1 Tax=Bradyrhizobium sp. USDA 336 TaxID=3156311 RepID=UPI0038373D18
MANGNRVRAEHLRDYGHMMCLRLISSIRSEANFASSLGSPISVLKLLRKGNPSIRLHLFMMARRSQDRKVAASRQGLHFADSEK